MKYLAIFLKFLLTLDIPTWEIPKTNPQQLLCCSDRPFSVPRYVKLGTLLQAQQGQSTGTQGRGIRRAEIKKCSSAAGQKARTVLANPTARPSVSFPWWTFAHWGARGAEDTLASCPGAQCLHPSDTWAPALTGTTAIRCRDVIIQGSRTITPGIPVSLSPEMAFFIYFIAAKLLRHHFMGFPIPAGCSVLKTKWRSY